MGKNKISTGLMFQQILRYDSFVVGSNDGHQAELTGSQNHINVIISEGAEKIGDKFKRKLRQTLNSMDQHSSGGMPAVQRARTTKGKRNDIINDIVQQYLLDT